ncbi:long-chain fatty acid--CoA ligase [Haloglomus irregulare]|jgi:acyl-CoA synthetase (AMP-forming)/AMP-acid ligase II|uniref:Long-chain fatty acid--CoA ligase n=1 Tax=Haloglomus irregulare TaxID=2234134 RepID=A0A554MVK2_9EURY|nr:AMP-binding protein [Haloglomus irregulare]TSD09157.1 long-chain fatty acid--CoA ligase [Haloglomus irregulare]
MQGLTIGALATRNAREQPDAPAIVERVDGRRELTFEAFDRRTTQLANALGDAGVGAGDTVAIYLRNSIETLETFIGAAKAGIIPVPINHRFKTGEIGYVLRDCGASICVFDDDAMDTVAGLTGEDLPVERFLHVGNAVAAPDFAESYGSFRESGAKTPPETDITRLDRAAMLYTSGTTGRPKGCQFTHDNLLQNTENTVYDVGLDRDERFLIMTPLFHVAAFALFLDAFYVGATTVLTADFDPDHVLEVIEDEQVTGSFVVPTQGRALLETNIENYDLSSFRRYWTGTAPSEAELKRDIIDTFDCGLTEMFGQTELSPLTLVLPPEDAFDKIETVGRPLFNVGVKLVDEDGAEVEQGKIGRIAYRGPTVFEGYHELPAANDEVFDGGWFVSSDLMREDEDGYFEFLGRADDMIISGGENIHPAEIEEVLHEHPAIDAAAVLGVPDEKWGERVKAVVVLEPGEELAAAAVVDYVAERLADFKKPREVDFRDELPRNPTGKVVKGDLE